ncbi:MAG TPA: hypothetical protein VE195_03495, partial [Acidobacteriaceae bacterium]|nr:hypothetical protein [Acidobacteriaceae bacterium]
TAEEDIFISPDSMESAMQGDLVLVELDGVGLGRCAAGSGLSGVGACGRIGSEGEVGLVPG